MVLNRVAVSQPVLKPSITQEKRQKIPLSPNLTCHEASASVHADSIQYFQPTGEIHGQSYMMRDEHHRPPSVERNEEYSRSSSIDLHPRKEDHSFKKVFLLPKSLNHHLEPSYLDRASSPLPPVYRSPTPLSTKNCDFVTQTSPIVSLGHSVSHENLLMKSYLYSPDSSESVHEMMEKLQQKVSPEIYLRGLATADLLFSHFDHLRADARRYGADHPYDIATPSADSLRDNNQSSEEASLSISGLAKRKVGRSMSGHRSTRRKRRPINLSIDPPVISASPTSGSNSLAGTSHQITLQSDLHVLASSQPNTHAAAALPSPAFRQYPAQSSEPSLTSTQSQSRNVFSSRLLEQSIGQLSPADRSPTPLLSSDRSSTPSLFPELNLASPLSLELPSSTLEHIEQILYPAHEREAAIFSHLEVLSRFLGDEVDDLISSDHQMNASKRASSETSSEREFVDHVFDWNGLE